MGAGIRIFAPWVIVAVLLYLLSTSTKMLSKQEAKRAMQQSSALRIAGVPLGKEVLNSAIQYKEAEG